MTASIFDPYFKEMDTYLNLRDLALNTRKNYHSSLKAYLTWLSETLAVSPEDATYENIRTYLLHLKQIRKRRMTRQYKRILRKVIVEKGRA